MKTSRLGIDLVKKFEGLFLNGYLCPAGVPTIGWGTTGKVDGVSISTGMAITEEKAEELLAADLARFEHRVEARVKVPLTQQQFDALVSFDYNTGALGRGEAGCTLLRKLNAKDYAGAAEQFLVWNKATNPNTHQLVVLPGLVRRRNSERHLFLTGELQFNF